MSSSEFPYRVTIHKDSWSMDIASWFSSEVGDENVKYIHPKDAFKYLRYGFRFKEDAVAFKLKFRV